MDEIDLTAYENDRYNRLKQIEWWDQKKLFDAKVMVVGCGALGNEVIKNLALLGVGSIVLVDFDVVETSNLTRSVLFRAKDRGQNKAEIAARMLKDINSDVRVCSLSKNINWEIGLGLYRRIDIILGCLDNREARLTVNRACWRTQKPWIDGGLQELMGSVKVFRPPYGACYECTFSQVDYELINENYSCAMQKNDVQEAVVPTTPTSASIIGAMQVQEMLKIIHEYKPSNVKSGYGYFYNGSTNLIDAISFKKSKSCQSHDYFENIIELPVGVWTHSISDLFEIIKTLLGENIILDLEMEIVISLDCSYCGHSQPVLKPLLSVPHSLMRCTSCGELNIPILTHQITGEESFLNLKLGEIGIPPLHIMVVRQKDTINFVELSADVNTVLNFH